MAEHGSAIFIFTEKRMGNTNSKMRAAILTLGCRVNQYESEAVAEELEAVGFEICDFNDDCDVYIINTCAVTAESERKSRQMVRRAAKRRGAGIIVMGCSAQVHGAEAFGGCGVFYVCGNRNKMTAAEAALSFVNGGFAENAFLDVEQAPIEKMSIRRSERTRAYVKIEDGCDNNCAYCIIKKARGAVVSRKISEICAEVDVLADAGYREIVLTGIETASFGKDTGERLSELIDRVSENEKIERIRLGSLEPSVLTKDFVDSIAKNKKFMPSFHLSLQSGSNAVLASMRRKYNIGRVIASVEYVKENVKDATFTADIITGFPGETDENFLETCAAAEKIGFLHMHIFPFSEREGTAAADMKNQVPEAVRRERAARLEMLGEEIKRSVYEKSLDGKARRVLFETPKDGYNVGHTPEMLEIYVKDERCLQGEIFPVIPTRYENGRLYGEIAEDKR